MKIATLAFAGSENTLGLDVVCNAVKAAFQDAVFEKATDSTTKHADYLFVTLYWWRDFYEFVSWLNVHGIDPREKKPVIIIGGMAALNPRPLIGYFHHAVIGDGEACIVELLKRLEAKETTEGIKGIWNPDGCELAIAESLPCNHYIDLRTNKTTRIEIARGCKGRCDFCQLAYLKPYRELPFDVARHLVITAPTKTISLFAPDRTSYSRIHDLDACLTKSGKANTGSDTRLETLRRHKSIDKVRFGVEGFSESTRKRFHKIVSNDILRDGLVYIASELTTTKGAPMTSATLYLIGDLPGEGKEHVAELWSVMSNVDKLINRKLTLFVSVSSFAPMPLTPMARCEIDPYTKCNEWFKQTRPHFKNIVIATRGACIAAPQRLSQMLTIRGDERARLAIHWLATKGKRYLRSTNPEDGKIVSQVVSKAGFPADALYKRVPKEQNMACDEIKPVIPVRSEW